MLKEKEEIMLSVEEIKNYWEDRAAGDPSAQSTTQDVYLREIELRTLFQRIKAIEPQSVVDIGCGDGRTTIGIARNLPDIKFTGFDYSAAMVENARNNLVSQSINNVEFGCHDIQNPLADQFDLAYTTRCLINLPDLELQRIAISNVHAALNKGGHYLMVENFVEGHDNFNQLRREYGLPEIAMRDHNLFFKRRRLLNDIKHLFEINEEINISSSYYLASRIIYSRICADTGIKPDYFDAHHRYAANLPFSGEFGPVRLLVMKKK